mgnify:CR=1 FL=1
MGLSDTSPTSPSLQEMLDAFPLSDSAVWAEQKQTAYPNPANYSKFQHTHTITPKQQHHPRQTFHFVDQTPVNDGQSPKKRRRGECPVDMDKSRIAQQRRRDNRGQFINNEVAARLEGKHFSLLAVHCLF